MLKQTRLLTRPTQARQDAPFRGQSRSSVADPCFTFYGSRFTAPLSDARTPLAGFFSILLEGEQFQIKCSFDEPGERKGSDAEGTGHQHKSLVGP